MVVFLLGLVVQRLTGLYMGMATIAFTLIVSVVAVNGGDLTGGAGGLYGALGEITMVHIVVVVVAVIALLAWTEATWPGATHRHGPRGPGAGQRPRHRRGALPPHVVPRSRA